MPEEPVAALSDWISGSPKTLSVPLVRPSEPGRERCGGLAGLVSITVANVPPPSVE